MTIRVTRVMLERMSEHEEKRCIERLWNGQLGGRTPEETLAGRALCRLGRGPAVRLSRGDAGSSRRCTTCGAGDALAVGRRCSRLRAGASRPAPRVGSTVAPGVRAVPQRAVRRRRRLGAAAGVGSDRRRLRDAPTASSACTPTTPTIATPCCACSGCEAERDAVDATPCARWDARRAGDGGGGRGRVRGGDAQPVGVRRAPARSGAGARAAGGRQTTRPRRAARACRARDLPLAGVRVLDLTRVIAGPSARASRGVRRRRAAHRSAGIRRGRRARRRDDRRQTARVPRPASSRRPRALRSAVDEAHVLVHGYCARTRSRRSALARARWRAHQPGAAQSSARTRTAGPVRGPAGAGSTAWCR